MQYLIFLFLVLPSLQAALPPIQTSQVSKIAVDPQGNPWFFGSARETLFTATPGALQPEYKPGICQNFGFFGAPTYSPCPDLYLIRLNREGTEIEAATYLGGSDAEYLQSVTFDAAGAVYLSGYSFSKDFPTAADATPLNQFIIKLNRDLTRIEYLRPSQPSITGLAVGPDGSAFTIEANCPGSPPCTSHVQRLDPTGQRVMWRSAIVPGDFQVGMALAPDGQSLWTAAGRQAQRINAADGRFLASVSLPLSGAVSAIAASDSGAALIGQNTSQGAFLTAINTTGQAAPPVAVGYAIYSFTQGPTNVLHIAGTGFTGVPVTENSLARCSTPTNENFVSGWEIDSNRLSYGTYIPEHNGSQLATRGGEVLLLKRQQQAGIDRLEPAQFPRQPACVRWPLVNLASSPNSQVLTRGSVAPGEFITIYGSGIGPSNEVKIEMDGRRTSAPRRIENTRVLFNGLPAALVGAKPNQLTVQVPYSVQNAATVRVQVEQDGELTPAIEVAVKDAVPAIISNGPPSGNSGAVYLSDWSVNSQQNLTKAGDVVTVFLTGGGRLANIADDAAALPNPAPETEMEVRANLLGSGGQVVTFAGGIPGQLPGLLQVNVRIAPDLIYYGWMLLQLSFGDQSVTTELWVQQPR